MDEQHTPDLKATGASVPVVAHGRLRVAEHVGQAAGDAAQAIRRAGLRPALERSFDHPDRPVGQVVAQEPAAGTEMPRGALVTIYVAARSVEAQDGEQEAGSPGERGASENDSPEPAAVQDTLGEDFQLAAEHELAFAASQQPAGQDGVERDDPREAGQAEAPVAAEAMLAAEAAEDEVSWGQPAAAGTVEVDALSEAVLHRAQEMFAERFTVRRAARERWRRPHWRPLDLSRARGSVRFRVGDRRWLLRGAWGALALWLLVGIVAALLGGGGHGARASHAAHDGRHRVAGATSARPRAETQQQAKSSQHRGEAAGASNVRAEGAAGHGAAVRRGLAGARRRERRRGGARPKRARAPARRAERQASGVPTGKRSAAPAPQQTPAVVNEPAPEPESPGVSASEQVGGGPFSP